MRPRVETISPLIEEIVGHRDRLVEQAAGIVAQVEDIALEFVGRDVGLEFLDRLLQAVGGLLVELSDADIADVAALVMLAHRLDRMTARVSLTSMRLLLRPRMILSFTAC